jgi:peptide/nickel transport system substrate-binding protein
MGRTPVGGALSMSLPWPTTSIDPHDLRDPAGALFGPAIADSLFALDRNAEPYPTLAAAMPTHEGGVTTVQLREGLRTARGVALDARDVIASVERARSRGASALLADVPVPTARRGDRLELAFARRLDPYALARTLASPLLALLPRGFEPARPDGTGAFRAEPSASRLTLVRNDLAARGAAFLDRVDVTRAPDLKASLRAFEAERDDLGWLGTGLFKDRNGAVRFDHGAVAWIVLAIGPVPGALGMPGVAQQLIDAIPPERLAHLGIGSTGQALGDPGWTGPAAELLVDESSPHLVEVARAVAPTLSRAGHEVTVAPIPRDELASRRGRGKALLALDLVRSVGPGPLLGLVALATADDPVRARDIIRHPRNIRPGTSMRQLTSTLRLGVLGELRVAGGVSPDIMLAGGLPAPGWDLGASFRRRKP